jgi:DNA-binding response OmpR family regulator
VIDLELDSRRRIVRRNGTTVRLGPTGFRIVELLARAPDGIEREGLRERIFIDRDDGGPSDESFSVIISQTRKKLRIIGLKILRTTRWGALYELQELV